MKIAGLIGGIAPESTIDYYRSIVQTYRARLNDGSYPPLVINSIDMTKMIGMISAGDLTGTSDYLAAEINRVASAGADFALLASNTPHIVFDELARRSQIPLISIVEAACEEARRLGLRRLGLFGSRYTMNSRFFPDVFERERIALVMPRPDEQDYVHEKYFTELVNAVFLPETRNGYLTIADRMRGEDGIEGLILAGTELPLLLRDVGDRGIPFLDTTKLHVAKIVDAILG
jgi:aspartate racemase